VHQDSSKRKAAKRQVKGAALLQAEGSPCRPRIQTHDKRRRKVAGGRRQKQVQQAGSEEAGGSAVCSVRKLCWPCRCCQQCACVCGGGRCAEPAQAGEGGGRRGAQTQNP